MAQSWKHGEYACWQNLKIEAWCKECGLHKFQQVSWRCRLTRGEASRRRRAREGGGDVKARRRPRNPACHYQLARLMWLRQNWVRNSPIMNCFSLNCFKCCKHSLLFHFITLLNIDVWNSSSFTHFIILYKYNKLCEFCSFMSSW